MKYARIFGAWVLGWCSFTPATAGEIQDLARGAEAKLQAGRHVEAVDDMLKALRRVHMRSPLTARTAVLVSDEPTGYGLFNPRQSNVFKTGEKLIAYIEPIGHTWQQEGSLFKAHIATDFDIKSPDGRVLATQRDFGQFKFSSRGENNEVMLRMTLDITGAPPDKYVWGITLRDQISGKSTTFNLPFEIR